AAGLRDEIRALRANGIARFNVNFMCHRVPPRDADAERRWQARLAPYCREFGIDPDALSTARPRAAFDAETAAAVVELRPPVVSFCYGLPDAALLDPVKASGATVIGAATTAAEARWLAQHGADVIVAQGLEAGGHRGMFLARDVASQKPLRELLPEVLRAVNVPVVAAGGISSAHAVRELLALGAVAVQVGSAYLLTAEALTKPPHRRALEGPDAGRTELTNLFSGGLARGIVNRLMRECGPVDRDVPAFPWASLALAPLRAAAEARGSGDFSPLWSGMSGAQGQPARAGDVTRRLAGVDPS
ncbi:MAG TPA: nitronate monooxygenase, partial [Nevskiaceae bacterium]